LDLIAPDRQTAIRGLVESEGFGWLLPRFAPAPWEQFVPEAWKITDSDDLAWVLARLRPTPFRHFTEPLRFDGAATELPPRVYVRCIGNPHPGFDRFAAAAQSSPGWAHRELPAAHLPYITDPDALVEVLVETAR
jgi:hypothetical protein